LGKIWAKMVLEVPGFEKNAIVYFLEVNFFGIFIGQVWGNLGKNPSHHQKVACSYTYD